MDLQERGFVLPLLSLRELKVTPRSPLGLLVAVSVRVPPPRPSSSPFLGSLTCTLEHYAQKLTCEALKFPAYSCFPSSLSNLAHVSNEVDWSVNSCRVFTAGDGLGTVTEEAGCPAKEVEAFPSPGT